MVYFCGGRGWQPPERTCKAAESSPAHGVVAKVSAVRCGPLPIPPQPCCQRRGHRAAGMDLSLKCKHTAVPWLLSTWLYRMSWALGAGGWRGDRLWNSMGFFSPWWIKMVVDSQAEHLACTWAGQGKLASFRRKMLSLLEREGPGKGKKYSHFPPVSQTREIKQERPLTVILLAKTMSQEVKK